MAALAAAAVPYVPTLRLGFAGDDFPWWHHAHMARLRPALLLAPFGGYRPANTWTLAVDDALFGTEPEGYRVTNLALLLTCAGLLAAAARREGAPVVAAAATATLLAWSPLVFEPATNVSDRFDLIQLAGWLGLALVWPRGGARWSRRHLAGVVALAALTAAAKESWVVLPGFVAVLELLVRRMPARRALRSAALAAAPAAAYAAWYFAHPAISPGAYYAGGLAAAAKLPHIWAAALGLARLRPAGWAFGPAEAVAAAAVAAAAWAAWRWRLAGVGYGLALMTLPVLPVLPVPTLTTRYTAAPWAGALLAGVSGLAALAAARPAWRRRAWSAAAVLAIAAAISGAVRLGHEREDLARWVALHARLVAEARAAVSSLPAVSRLVAVRLERDDLLRGLPGTERGLEKAYFVRVGAPYGLVEWADLLTFADAARGGRIWVAESQPPSPGRARFAVLAHRRGGFAILPASEPSAAEEAGLWRSRGVPVRLLRLWLP